MLQARIALSLHAARGEHRDLVARVLTDALALTQSATARLDVSSLDQAALACTALATQGEGGYEFSIEGPPGCPWGEEPLPPGKTRSVGGGHWTAGVTGKEPPNLLRGSRLDFSALSQTSGAPDVRLTVSGRAGSFTPTDRATLEQLASMAQDAIGTLQARSALQISERRAQLALEAARDGMWDWDVPSGRISVNDAYFAMLGEGNAGGHLMIAEWQSRIHPHDQPKLRQRVETLVSEAAFMEAEYRLRHADGGWCWVQSRAEIVERDAQGRARRVVGTHTDITRIKEAEREAVQARIKLEAALASMSDAVFISDMHGNLVHMNQAFATYHRFASLSECAERLDAYPDILEVSRLDGTRVPLSQWAVPRALRGETAVDQRYRLRRKDTGDTWVGSYKLGPIRDADGRVVGAVVTCRDITEQHAAEQALRISEERHRLFYNPVFGGSIIHDKGHVLDCSKGITNVTGYSYNELIGMNGLLLIAPDWREFVKEKIASGFEKAYEAESIRKDGSIFPVRLHAAATHYDGKPARVVEFRDITETKKIERALKKSENLLRNVIDSSVDYIFAKDTHLRTILCNVRFAQSVNAKPSDLVGKTDIENGWDADLVKGNSDKGIKGYEKDDLEALNGNIVRITETARIAGQTLLLDTVKIPLKDENHQIFGVLGISRDVTAQKRAEQCLKASEEQFRTLVNSSPFPVVIVDTKNEKIQYWSDSAEELFGHRPQTPAEWFALAYPDPDYRQAVIERSTPYLERAQQTTTAVNTGEYEIRCRDGAVKICEIYAQSIPGHMVLINHDITERKQAERQQRLAASVFAHSLNGVVIADPEMRILDANRTYCELTGFTKAELLGQPLARLVAGDDDRSLPDTLRADLDEQGHGQTEIDARSKDGAPFPAMLSLSCVSDADGEVQNHIASVADISALKAHAADLERLAHHDALTGLPNRRLLLDRLAQAIALADRTGGSLAVCYLDLDGFKPINDRHGHEVGDQYLIAVGGMLQANLRRHDSVARIGGDEFVLMLTELQRPEEDCSAQLDRILAAIHEPVILDGIRHQVAASIGVTLYPGDHADADDLLDHADQAMYRAKQSGGCCYRIYQSER
ncbi:PAS domain S-box protein [Thiorhodovibrio litoralis]|uniref:PAS domain S-box protein n=1 Tax=Thiorhodovibrio litoralis TaxID=2952932 RepID=UPI002B258482|nr:PAS domain S-box protein [Thiorhodovibrio litoralis]